MSNPNLEAIPFGSPEFLLGYDAGNAPVKVATHVPRPLRQAWAKYKNGASDFVVLGMGSSSMRGQLSTTGMVPAKTTADNYKWNFLRRVADLLKQRGEFARHDSLFGNGLDGNTIATYDNRVVITGNWINSPGVVLGGLGFRCATIGDKITVTPTDPWDTAEIMYGTTNAAGSASVKIDSIAPTTGVATIDRNTGSETIAKTIVVGASIKVQALELALLAGSSFRLSNIRFRRSDRKETEILNAGWVGQNIIDGKMPENYFNPTYAVTGTTLQSPYNIMLALGKIDLILFYVGGNEEVSGASPTDTIARLKQWADAAVSIGATVGIITPMAATGFTGVIYPYLRQAAIDNGWMLCDEAVHKGPYTSVAADWWMNGNDGTHPNAFGQQDTAVNVDRAFFPR